MSAICGLWLREDDMETRRGIIQLSSKALVRFLGLPKDHQVLYVDYNPIHNPKMLMIVIEGDNMPDYGDYGKLTIVERKPEWT